MAPDPTMAPEDRLLAALRAQKRYREGPARLIHDARPGVGLAECRRRAADVDIVQNGLWLTALLRLDRAALRRAVVRCAG